METSMSLQNVLRLFQGISGMNIAVFDHLFHPVSSCLYGRNVCATLHESPLCVEKCLLSDLEALAHVSKTARPYAYTCPFGFFEAIFPILKQGTVIGYILIGPAVAGEHEQDEALLSRMVACAPELELSLLREGISEVTHRTDAELKSFCDVLAVFSEYVENHDLLIPKNLTVGQLVRSYVHKNLTQKITLAKLSMALHCNTVTLTETFRKECGMTIMQYVLQERMARATYLLRTSDAGIAEIAARCGIPQTEYFSKCFKTYYGVSPTDWRRRACQVREGITPASGAKQASDFPSTEVPAPYDSEIEGEEFRCLPTDQP